MRRRTRTPGLIPAILVVGRAQAWLAHEFRSTLRESNPLLALPWLALVVTMWAPLRLLYVGLYAAFVA